MRWPRRPNLRRSGPQRLHARSKNRIDVMQAAVDEVVRASRGKSADEVANAIRQRLAPDGITWTDGAVISPGELGDFAAGQARHRLPSVSLPRHAPNALRLPPVLEGIPRRPLGAALSLIECVPRGPHYPRSARTTTRSLLIMNVIRR